MRALLVVTLLFFPMACATGKSPRPERTGFNEMLRAAERGDSMARVVVGYSYYFGEYRDGMEVEQNVDRAYAWASLANYQGNPEAQKLLNLVIPRLKDREAADTLAGQYFLKYGAERGSAVK